jgi:hypothetical protein
LRRLQADRMASPRPAPVISRRAGRTTSVDTRGWMGGVSRRAILSIKPETFFRAVSETSLKTPRSLACRFGKPMTLCIRLSRDLNSIFVLCRRILATFER